MWWLFTRKVQKHPVIQPGEIVHRACYGMGEGIVGIANHLVSANSAMPIEAWSAADGTGLATPIDRTGIVALTDRRLLFFAKRLAIGTPKILTAEWPLEQLRDILWDDDTLTLSFRDGSAAKLHVPSNQSPKKLVQAWRDQARQD